MLGWGTRQALSKRILLNIFNSVNQAEGRGAGDMTKDALSTKQHDALPLTLEWDQRQI